MIGPGSFFLAMLQGALPIEIAKDSDPGPETGSSARPGIGVLVLMLELRRSYLTLAKQ